MTVEVATYNAENGIRFLNTQHRPSWKRFGKGWSEVQCHAHPKGEWFQISTSEVSKDDINGKLSRKETMVALSADETRALYEFLKARLGE